MRKLFLGFAFFAALSTPAFAGGVLVAPPPPTFSTPNGSGWYLGAGTSAAIASENVSGNVISLPGLSGGGVTAAGAAVEADVGYIWGRCVLNTWCQVEADARYTSVDGASSVGTLSTRWGFTQEFDVGADILQTIAALLPSASNPFPSFDPSSLLPRNIAVSTTPRGYIGFKQEELLISGNVGQAGGQSWAYAPGVTSGFRWQTLGADGKPNGGSLKIFADILWPTKGLALSNVFGAGGAPVVTQPNASLNTLYVAGIHYDFGVGR